MTKTLANFSSLCFIGFISLFPVLSAEERGASIEPADNSASVVNVMDFGAVGDGQTDNTEAFQKALDSLKPLGGTVEVPVGQYRFSGSLNVPQGVTLRGPWNSVTAHNGCRDRGLPKPTDDGATFIVTANPGDANAEAFITLNTNSVVDEG